MKNSYLTVTDQFCGAGGSSQGVRNVGRRVGGVEVKMAMNHWKLAVETHNTNFPECDHDCTDISASDPRKYPSTDILITSPECTTHSPAGGNNHKRLKAQMDMFDKNEIDPSTERSRATMWDVCRFTEYHKYNIIIVENVVEAKTRWPLFDIWLKAMDVLGYHHKICYLNSQHFQPTPQSRDRIYVVLWKKGNKAPDLNYTPTAWCHKCEKQVNSVQSWKNPHKPFGKYRMQYLYRCPSCTLEVEPYYYAAFNLIDWSIPGKPVLGRKVPLRPNTIRRIEYGLKKFGKDPLIITTRSSSGVEYRGQGCHSIISPFMIQSSGTGGRIDISTRNTLDPCRTVTTADNMGIVSPFIIELNRTGKARGVFDPLSTVLANGNHHAVVQSPIITELNGHGKARSVNSPAPTMTTREKIGIIQPESFSCFLSYYYNTSQVSLISEAARTITTKDRIALVEYKTPTLEEVTYRTIRPHEVKKAMAFADDYVILGNSKDKVKQCGNAVTPPVMEWLVERCLDSLNY